MWLVCRPCKDRGIERSDGPESSMRLLAKYYPSTDWYPWDEPDEMAAWLEFHTHGEPSEIGPTDFEIEYEARAERRCP
jgi:hypothetical protein